MANQKLNEVTTVPTASINNVKTFLAVMNDGSIQQMTKADMASVLGELIGIATREKSGLMPAGGFVALGVMSGQNLQDIRDGYGYGFGNADGSNMYGPFLSISGGESKLQIKAEHTGGIIMFRTKRADGDKSWSNWRKILTE